MHARLEAARARLEAALAGAPACLLPPYTAYPARLAPLATSTDAPLEAAGGRRCVGRRSECVPPPLHAGVVGGTDGRLILR